MEIKRSEKDYSCAVITVMRGRPGTRRIRTDVFFGISIASSRYSEKNSKQRKYKDHECKHVGKIQCTNQHKGNQSRQNIAQY